MKTTNRVWYSVSALSLLLTAHVFPTVLAAKVADAPGVQKKIPLEITDISVSSTPTTVTVSWTTSQPSYGSIVIAYEFDGVGYVDPRYGTHHEMTVTGLTPGQSYGLTVESHTDRYGGVAWSGSFETPSL